MDTVFLALRVVVSLGAVLAVIWFARRWLTGGAKARARTRHVTVLAKQAVGAKATIAVVEADGRRYLLGVTEHAVSVLDQLDPAPAEVATRPIPLPSFARALEEAQSAPQPPRDPIPLLPATRRAAREAEAAQGQKPAASGSILSPDTWRQTAMALRRAR
ncbi:flagellar biosynthetic protein FliO [Naasia sp. SYSU D00057]|uniref:flagellar biosynthetic protein FliO n=1 Tax=Naasia sp. SYSU D00057 TaxID=2817380 RepID=UPI001B30F9BD|nr:flagellar biosynthetic protein FliO [Naasia sp. SYSU D00057]